MEILLIILWMDNQILFTPTFVCLRSFYNYTLACQIFEFISREKRRDSNLLSRFLRIWRILALVCYNSDFRYFRPVSIVLSYSSISSYFLPFHLYTLTSSLSPSALYLLNLHPSTRNCFQNSLKLLPYLCQTAFSKLLRSLMVNI